LSTPTPDDVRDFLANFLNGKLQEHGERSPRELSDEFDLLTSGLVDSITFVEMLAATSEHFAGDIDFSGLDPERMTVIGSLCTFVSEQLRARV